MNAFMRVLIKTLQYNYIKEEIEKTVHNMDNMDIGSCLHACACACVHACCNCADLLVYVCLHGILISFLLVDCIYEMFHHTETYIYIIIVL